MALLPPFCLTRKSHFPSLGLQLLKLENHHKSYPPALPSPVASLQRANEEWNWGCRRNEYSLSIRSVHSARQGLEQCGNKHSVIILITIIGTTIYQILALWRARVRRVMCVSSFNEMGVIIILSPFHR